MNNGNTMKILMLLNFAQGSRSSGSPGTSGASSDPTADAIRRTSGSKVNPRPAQTSMCHFKHVSQSLGHDTHHPPSKNPLPNVPPTFPNEANKKQTRLKSTRVSFYCAPFCNSGMLTVGAPDVQSKHGLPGRWSWGGRGAGTA